MTKIGGNLPTDLPDKNPDQTVGKPKYKGQTFRVNPENVNDYFHVSVACLLCVLFGTDMLASLQTTSRPTSWPRQVALAESTSRWLAAGILHYFLEAHNGLLKWSAL